MPSPYYPSAISHACAFIDESILFKNMPDGYIRVLLRIIKKINLRNPFQPIVASRSTLAKESGKSIGTVHRVVKWLEDQGLILRSQTARHDQKGSSSPITLTKKLADELGLIKAQEDTKETGMRSENQQMERQKNQRGQSTDASPSNAFTRIGNMKIPTDLVWLVTKLGLKATGLLQLMKKAKAVQQRLSDVVSSVRSYLEPLDGRSVYAYLHAMLGKGKDFSLQARQKTEEQQSQQERDHLKHKSISMAGRKFMTRDGCRTLTVEENGMLLDQQQGRRTVRPMTQSFLDAIEAGRLVPLREATYI